MEKDKLYSQWIYKATIMGMTDNFHITIAASDIDEALEIAKTVGSVKMIRETNNEIIISKDE